VILPKALAGASRIEIAQAGVVKSSRSIQPGQDPFQQILAFPVRAARDDLLFFIDRHPQWFFE
jgi:hypothetical protein